MPEMRIDRKKFFDAVRKTPFKGRIAPEAVWGMTAILNEWERRGLTDLRHLAYMLATVLAECGSNMLPVREGFAKSDAAARAHVSRMGYKYARQEASGHVYYGRGLVQLTWLFNYQAMSKILGIDLVNKPDLALEPKIAAQIMFEGMARGTFTKKKLSDYFNATVSDWRNARRIINGTDRADEIAGYGKAFNFALVSAKEVGEPVLPPDVEPIPPVPVPVPPPKPPAPTPKGIGATIGGIAIAALAWVADNKWALAGVSTIVSVAVAFWLWRRWKPQGASLWRTGNKSAGKPLPPAPPSSGASSASSFRSPEGDSSPSGESRK
jgi:hypothetical protein